MDIRRLNDPVISDSYSLPLKFKIIINNQEYTNLEVLEAALFFLSVITSF